ncbi:MAG: hypothetical protein AAFQ79_18085 [Pseudomonadota bacterium]
MGEAAVALGADWTRTLVTETADLRMVYWGPRDTRGLRIVVAFPPFDYPFDGDGWGARSFAKRGIGHVCVFHRRPDWYQNDSFFDAMEACREFLAPAAGVTAYGFSMGGLGALLGARALGADRAVAITPQVTIDPSVPPRERRFVPQWEAMGPWQHDLLAHMDDNRRYIVLFDPLHARDRRQEALIPRVTGYERCLMHGAGHAPIQALAQMGVAEALFDVLTAKRSPRHLRQAYRAARPHGFRYLRKVGTELHARRHPMAARCLEHAERAGFRRLVKRWART